MSLTATNSKEETTPLVNRQENVVENEDFKSFGPLSCYAVTLNCTVGTGAFGLPYAFSVTGYLLTTVILLVGGFMNYIGNSYVLEFLARTECVMSKREQDSNDSPDNDIGSKIVRKGSVILTEECELANIDGTFDEFYQENDSLGASSSSYSNHESDIVEDGVCKLASNSFVFKKEWETQPQYNISYRKFDFTFIARLFGGSISEKITFTSMLLYCLGTLWAYSSVFPSSASTIYFSFVRHEECDVFAENVSSACNLSYYVFLIIYATIVIALSIIGMSNGALVQNILALYRVIAFSIMFITLGIKIQSDGSEIIINRLSNIGAFNWSHFANGFGTILLSCCCAYNIPDLVQPLENKKKYAHSVITASLSTSVIIYLLLGVLGSIGFDKTNELVTLDWANYSGCGNGWSKCPDESSRLLASIIQLIVMLFPPICVTSAFPIVCITMAANMEGLLEKTYSRYSLDNFFNGHSSLFMRLIIASPPIILAGIFKKLSTIFTLSGLFGFVLSLIIPCLLEYLSIRAIKSIWIGSNVEKTPFDTCFSTERISVFLASLGIIFLGTATYAFIHDHIFS